MGGRDLSGRKLERLVAMLERVLADTNATIEAPSRRLTDRDTGRPREHDVLVVWDHGHHRIVTAIECRDRSRPIGVPAVEAFADKCASTGVHSGVMVSTTGFTSTARVKAQARSITCMDLEDAGKFDWLGMSEVSGYERLFPHIDLRLIFEAGEPDAIRSIFDTEGNDVSVDQLVHMVRNNVPVSDDPDSEVGREVPVTMRINTLNWIARDGQGKDWPIDHIKAVTSFTTTKVVTNVEAHRYAGGGQDYSIASAPVALAGLDGRLMIVRNADDTTSIYWVPDKHGSPASD